MAEYYIKRITPPARTPVFAVTKFEGADEPAAIYHVVWNRQRDEMICDCPNRRRGRGTDDKHGRMVRDWLAAGEPNGQVSAPQGSYERTKPYQDPDDDIPF